jgi:hypothetical protein
MTTIADSQTPKRRWPYFRGQVQLLLAGLALLFGSALPWAYILGNLLTAAPLALMWTAWAGIVTIAAAIAPWRPAVLFSAFAGGATAVAFAVWQTGRIVGVCSLSLDCLPGPGVGFLLAGGLAALHSAIQIVRSA